MSQFDNASTYRGGATRCPKCASTDVKVAETEPDRNCNFTRTHWCRACWAEISVVKLHEDRPERLVAR
jgi:hypothetical protein